MEQINKILKVNIHRKEINEVKLMYERVVKKLEKMIAKEKLSAKDEKEFDIIMAQAVALSDLLDLKN